MDHFLNSILSILKYLRIYFEFAQDRENSNVRKIKFKFFFEDDALL